MINQIHNANCLEFLKTMPSEYVDCLVTSPPYWGLRDYEIEGQLGQEESPDLYIQNLIEIFNEVKRVLKKTGTCWVNIGDTYAGTGSKGKHKDPKYSKGRNGQTIALNNKVEGVKRKSLCQIPERFSIAMTDNGWIKRNTIIWYKRNAMPSSVKDRFTVDFEYLYFFTKDQKYWFEQQYEPMVYPGRVYNKDTSEHKTTKLKESGNRTTGRLHDGRKQYGNPSLGRNMRCVWDVPTEPYPKAHFAVYPRSLITTCIKAGCSPNGIVLDPFSGAGTTALEAKEQGKNYIGIEINPEYVKMSEKRLNKDE